MKRKLYTLAAMLLLTATTLCAQRLRSESPKAKLQWAEMAITNLYVDTVDENKLVEDAIRGMLEKLDPHSTYSTAKEVKALNDCGEFFRGVAYSHEDEKQCGENVVLVMRGNNIKSGHIVDDSDRVFIDKAIVGQDQLMTKFSVLFAMSSGSKEHVGKTAVYYDYPAMAAYGAFCSKYVPSDSYRYFMFNFLSSSTYRAFVKRICGGTGINNMKEEYFNVPLFALPGDIGQVRKFNELTATIYAQVYNCTQEMSKLMSLRDFLLPLLMNGQVKVG